MPNQESRPVNLILRDHVGRRQIVEAQLVPPNVIPDRVKGRGIIRHATKEQEFVLSVLLHDTWFQIQNRDFRIEEIQDIDSNS